MENSKRDDEAGDHSDVPPGQQSNEKSSANSISRHLSLAVDCHGWEDFPIHHTGTQAAELLAGWTALWHPAVLVACQTVPEWQRIDELPEPAAGAVVLVPRFVEATLTREQIGRLTDLGGQYVFGGSDRTDCVERILESIPDADLEVSADQQRDFFSLGYCYLQIQLMTRQLRYVSTLDESLFRQQLLTAVSAVESGNPEACEQALQGCFDLIIEERSRYYPTTATLIDCLYLNDQIPHSAIRQSLEMPHRFSLQLSGCLRDYLEREPAVVERLRQRLAQGDVSLVAGPWHELANSLLSSASVVHQLGVSAAALVAAFPETTISVFGRRRFGLSPTTPAAIRLAGLENAIHATLDDGVFPQTAPNHMRWQGDDGTTIDALTAPPRLADAPETWLRLAVTIGECIDANHYATLFVVHWPGQQHDAWEDLIASARFGNVLGQFVTLNEYFDQVSDPGFSQDYPADHYRNPWLTQLFQAEADNPISRFTNYWRRQTGLLARQGIQAMLAVCGQSSVSSADDQMSVDLGSEQSPGDTELGDADTGQLADRLVPAMWDSGGQPRGAAGPAGRLLINPFSFPGHAATSPRQMVNVPALGFSWVADDSPTPAPRQRRNKPIPMVVDETTLRNEFMIVEFNSESGGIAAVKRHNRRGNLLSQQVARRLASDSVARGGQRAARYSEMIADSIEVVEEGHVHAAVQSSGRLMYEKREIGTFRQITRLSRGQPVARLELDVTVNEKIRGNPWDNYLACRFAWHDETANLFTWLNESRQPTSLHRITSPLALEIDQSAGTTCIFPGGLPFHQKIGYRRLDTILVTARETCRKWTLGFGVDVKYPLAAGLSLIHPPLELENRIQPKNATDSGWLFHLNCRNVMILRWQIPDGEPTVGPETGRGPESIRILVRETEGRPAHVTLDCGRPICEAQQVDWSGQRRQKLEICDGKVRWHMVARELMYIELVWN